MIGSLLANRDILFPAFAIGLAVGWLIALFRSSRETSDLLDALDSAFDFSCSLLEDRSFYEEQRQIYFEGFDPDGCDLICRDSGEV